MPHARGIRRGNARVQLIERGVQLADNAEAHGILPAYLFRGKVYLNNVGQIESPSVRGNAGHTGSQHEHAVRFFEHPAAELRAVAAACAEDKGVLRRDGRDAVECGDDRRTELFSQLNDLAAAMAHLHTVAAPDRDFFVPCKLAYYRIYLRVGGLYGHVRTVALHALGCVVTLAFFYNVSVKIDNDRAGTAGHRHAVCLAHCPDDGVGMAHGDIFFHYAGKQLFMVSFLRVAAPCTGERVLKHERYERAGISQRAADGGYKIRRPRTCCGEAKTGFAGEPPVHVGSTGGYALVPGLDKAYI